MGYFIHIGGLYWGDRMTDSLSKDPLHTYAEASAFLGGVVLLGFVATGFLTLIEVFLSVAVLVVVPLCLRLVSTPYPDGKHSVWYKTATYTQPGVAPHPCSFNAHTSPPHRSGRDGDAQNTARVTGGTPVLTVRPSLGED